MFHLDSLPAALLLLLLLLPTVSTVVSAPLPAVNMVGVTTSPQPQPQPPPPPIWSKECSDIYSPVRVIGRGGFAEVWMAKCKETSSSSSRSDGDTHVAIKVAGNDAYSQREVAILSELSQTPHPNIVHLMNEFKGEEVGGHHILVMSLHRGPTLKYIIEQGGALGLKVAQSISKQLIDAIAYLHGHGVIHRDIQPANLIISQAMLDDELWWSDEFDVDGKVLAHTKKCHVTLVDFGFARGKWSCKQEERSDVVHNYSETNFIVVDSSCTTRHRRKFKVRHRLCYYS